MSRTVIPGNLYKVEEWSRDGMRVDSLLYVGNDKAVGQRPGLQSWKQRLRLAKPRFPHELEQHPSLDY